jgi:hypothetical protein
MPCQPKVLAISVKPITGPLAVSLAVIGSGIWVTALPTTAWSKLIELSLRFAPSPINMSAMTPATMAMVLFNIFAPWVYLIQQ